MIRLLGVGSPFGADQLAWEAVDHLAGAGLADCELIKLDRPGSGLLAWFDGVEHLILLDALAIDSEAGRSRLLEPCDLERLSPGTSSHGFGVAQALDLAVQLEQLPSRVDIVGIATGADLSSLPELDTQALEGLVRSLL
jgi:hydrogenase maturation protease